MANASDDPGANFPPECAQLMERTMECVKSGDISGCLKMQAKVNDCLRHHGLGEQAVELPAEYFSLMHESILAVRGGDDAKVDELSAKMDEIFYGITGGEEE